jgi:hypothetical protein
MNIYGGLPPKPSCHLTVHQANNLAMIDDGIGRRKVVVNEANVGIWVPFRENNVFSSSWMPLYERCTGELATRLTGLHDEIQHIFPTK